MTFLHAGLALAGLAAISIPIIIHLLFRQRRKPVLWGAMRFLIEAYRKAQRRMRLEQLLLLTVRCLIVGLLGLALARPLLTGSALPLTQGGRVVYLLIDNSLASSVQGEGGATALSRHKEQARALVEHLSASDRVGLIALARPTEAIVDPPAVDHAAVRRMIEDLPQQETPADLDAALNRLRESLEAQSGDPSPVIVYLLSDFLAGSVDLGEPLTARLSAGDTARRSIVLVASPPAEQSPVNVQITSIESLRPVALAGEADLSGQFTVRLRRVGDVRREHITTVRLNADPIRPPDPVVIRWQPGQSEAKADFRLDLGGQESGEVVVTCSIDRDVLAADNQRFNVMDVRDTVRVAVMDRREFGQRGDLTAFPAGSWFRRALDPGAGSRLVVDDVDPQALDRAVLRRTAAVILTRPDLVVDEGWRVLREFVDGGGLLWIVPAEEQSIALWPDAAVEHLGLHWRWAREVVTADERAGPSPAPVSGTGDTDPTGWHLAAEQPRSELLDLLAAELAELTRPVQVYRYLPIEEGLETDSTLLVLDGPPAEPGAQGAIPWMVAAAPRDGAGLVVYLASSPHLDWTTLPSRPLMVALVHETIRQGIGQPARRRTLHPGDLPATAHLPPRTTTLRGPRGEMWSVTTRGMQTQNAMTTAVLDRPLGSSGVYTALDEAGQPISRLAVNVQPDAGRTEAQSPTAVAEWLGRSGSWTWADPQNVAASLSQEHTRSEISLILLMIVVVLAVLETMLARWFSHASRTDVASHGLDAHAAALAPTLGPPGKGAWASSPSRTQLASHGLKAHAPGRVA